MELCMNSTDAFEVIRTLTCRGKAMKFSRSSTEIPSPAELQDLEKLRVLIERAIADGKVSKQEMECIKVAMNADGKVTFEELELCRTLIWEKIHQGELEYDWWS